MALYQHVHLKYPGVGGISFRIHFLFWSTFLMGHFSNPKSVALQTNHHHCSISLGYSLLDVKYISSIPCDLAPGFSFSLHCGPFSLHDILWTKSNLFEKYEEKSILFVIIGHSRFSLVD
jgi:hypothetical protein